MKENKWYYYDPDKSPRGLECRYRKIGRTIQIEIPGTNSFWDWLVNIFGSFFTTKRYDYKIHKRWYYMAFRFFRVLKPIIKKYEIMHVRISGLSLGGAIGVILSFIFLRKVVNFYECQAFGSPNCGIPYIVTVNRGDIVPYVPFWGAKSMKIKQGKWQPFWIAHNSYSWRFK